MVQEIVLSDAFQVLRPALHDAKVRGLLLCSDSRVVMPVELRDNSRYCIVMHGAERFRADDFHLGNIILDVTVTQGNDIEIEDVADAFGVESSSMPFLSVTMDRLVKESAVVVRINPSYGCAAVCICRKFEIAAWGASDVGKLFQCW